LEPGHSKTMMAAFIIAVRGTVFQAILLGLAAAVSHSLLIWILAAMALYFGQQFNLETTEPYFQVGSGVLILATALWMAWRTRREIKAEADHRHAHDPHGHDHEAEQAHAHSHDHDQELLEPIDYQDAHEKMHAVEIENCFANRQVTTGQIVLFGITGGLMPCPAAFTILLLCLQLKKFTLGFSLVLCFSIGLALTLVTVGALAAWSVHHATKRFEGFGQMSRHLPYLSSAVLGLLGCYLIFSGLRVVL
jgi:nickel/cobalt exporter